ncbi:Uncharacterized conserved protein, contains HEPN domain [Pilibacter termitis]|uniref:Uncharacterized conserved protein, contains HEPN domain n=1 Tax=Pilibacter termitis TaxID=263852 RepID=A0A1T4MBL9_9ENTE|nr:hypothetical protein [Pilibacter termitis]SJZ64419.1 Uncharacterized conserved protein, contains HEPN domain [Pilibacter termitis]
MRNRKLYWDFDNDVEVINTMLRYISEISEMIERFKGDMKLYESDYAFRYALDMPLFQIQELTQSKLSDDFKSRFSDEVNFNSIRLNRNDLAHAYGVIDYEDEWYTIKIWLPTYEEFLLKAKRILNSELDENN